MVVTGFVTPIARDIIDRNSPTEMAATVIETVKQTVHGMKSGAEILASVGIIVTVINIVVDVLLATGVPSKITLALIDLSGGSMLIAAILAMIISIILGLGMPTVAAYTIVSILLAPTFINQFGVPELAAHFFVLYAAILSGITPPVASTVAITAGIAGSDFLESCWRAVKIFAPMFVIPFSFLYQPELVIGELSVRLGITLLFVMIGALSMIHGLNYLAGSSYRIKAIRTGYVLLGSFLMVVPSRTVQLAALVGVVVLHLVGDLSDTDLSMITKKLKTQ